MEVGCNTYSLKSCSRATAFALMRELGFEAVELWTGHASYLQADCDPRAVAEEARAAGLEIRAFCIGGLFGLPLPSVADRLGKAFVFARGLGVDLVTGIVDRQALEMVDRLCGEHGMRFAIENHWYTDFARPADYAEVLARRSPEVGINIDTGHFAFLGCDLSQVAAALGPRTMNVHLKTVRPPGRAALAIRRWRRQHRMEPTLPGAGDRLDSFVAALGSSGYDGMLAVEHEAETLRLDDLKLYRARAASLLADRAET